MKKERLISIIDTADETKISLLYDLWSDLSDTQTTDLTKEQLGVIDQRRNELLSDTAVLTDWKAMHDNIRKRRVA